MRPFTSALLVLAIIVAVAGVSFANLLQIRQAIGVSDRKWCATLELLTSHPVARPADAAANPSREQSWLLYSDFVRLRRANGCPPH